MIEKLFERLPYDFLEGVKYVHLLLVSLGVGVAIFAGYYFTLYQAAHEELVQLQTKRTQTEQKLKSYQILVSKKDSIAKELARSTGNLETMKQQLPRVKDMPDLLKQVAEFGGSHSKFHLLSFQLQEGKAQDFYQEIPVNIRVQGVFWDTLDFLDKMQNLMQLVDFSELQMNLKTNSSGGKGVQVILDSSESKDYQLYTNFVARIYAYVEGAEDKVAGTPAPANGANPAVK